MGAEAVVDRVQQAPRRAAAEPERTPPGAAILPDHRPAAVAQHALADAARDGPRAVAQRQQLVEAFGRHAVIQLGNKGGREAQEGEKKKEEEGAKRPAPPLREQSGERVELAQRVLGELVGGAKGLPAAFAIAAAGSFARLEMTKGSDLDIFWVVEEQASEEEKDALNHVCLAFVKHMNTEYGLTAEVEPSGTVAYIKKRDGKGNFGRDVLVLCEQHGAALAQQVAKLTASELMGIIDEVASKAAAAVRAEKANEALDVKMSLYRVLHLYARLLGQAFAFPGAPNSIDIIDGVMDAENRRKLLVDLRAALLAVHEMREAGQATLEAGKATKALRKSIVRDLFPRLRNAVGAYQASGDRNDLLKG